ncbi:alpha/beta fold hydrolase [Negadavirga shengliensis]|uniref:Alpha/beta fold hydrolase n=1 Tax=Negadavirga shengliensis TaxID=1389218 RepID=A0ABV9T4K9_9BACT
MPYIQIKGAQLFYIQEGAGGEVILFSHGLFWSHMMFEKQIREFKEGYTVIAYDHRGQGKSGCADGDFSLDALTEDAVEIIDKLAGKAVHFVGLGMGGFIGLRLAARYPDKIKTLVLMETSASPEPVENLPKYRFLNGLIKWFGFIPLVTAKLMEVLFAESWIKSTENRQAYKYWRQQLGGNSKSMHHSFKAVMERKGIEEEVRGIRCPVMIIVGDEDVATKSEKAKYLQMAIPDSKLHVLPGSGHSISIEKPGEVNVLIRQFLDDSPA